MSDAIFLLAQEPEPAEFLCHDLGMTFAETFLSQALAASVGAIVGIAGVFIGFALQRRVSREADFDRAIQEILSALSEYAHIVSGLEFAWANWSVRSNEPTPKFPNGIVVRMAIGISKLRATKAEIHAVGEMEQFWRECAGDSGREATVDDCNLLATALTEWRFASRKLSKRKSAMETFVDEMTRGLNAMEARRRGD